ncbi:MAG: PilT/PilU family type 4a pilus ATPase [Candidatus Brocadiia bacterium]
MVAYPDDKPSGGEATPQPPPGDANPFLGQFFNTEGSFLPPPSKEAKKEASESEVHDKLHRILKISKNIGASDIFLKVGIPPAIRVDGQVQFLKFDEMTDREMRIILEKMCDKYLIEQFRDEHEVDSAYQIDGVGRFRVSVFLQRGFIGIVMRLVKFEIPTFEQLNLPTDTFVKLCGERRGLILLTGITGSGKTTTLASFLEYINTHFNRHIITVEDPIEFIYSDKRSIIDQREIGVDTRSFGSALKHVVRQSPDVILVGEMRDLETMEAAINAAETGHLVFSTLHSTNAPQTLDRILNFFPPHQHELIRSQLATVTKGIISQRLIKRLDSLGRVPSVEIMTSSPTVKQAIEEGRFLDLAKIIDESAYFGMQSFNTSLINLIQKRMISREEALANSDDPDRLLLAFRGISKSAGSAQEALNQQSQPGKSPAGGPTSEEEKRKRRSEDFMGGRNK